MSTEPRRDDAKVEAAVTTARLAEPARDDAFATARSSWGFPSFAKTFPRDPELDALVVAFTRGDYRSVRARAPELARTATDETVKRAALELRGRIEPDGSSKLLFLVAAALLVFLTAWWITHDGAEETPPTKYGSREHVH